MKKKKATFRQKLEFSNIMLGMGLGVFNAWLSIFVYKWIIGRLPSGNEFHSFAFAGLVMGAVWVWTYPKERQLKKRVVPVIESIDEDTIAVSDGDEEEDESGDDEQNTILEEENKADVDIVPEPPKYEGGEKHGNTK